MGVRISDTERRLRNFTIVICPLQFLWKLKLGMKGVQQPLHASALLCKLRVYFAQKCWMGELLAMVPRVSDSTRLICNKACTLWILWIESQDLNLLTIEITLFSCQGFQLFCWHDLKTAFQKVEKGQFDYHLFNSHLNPKYNSFIINNDT